MESKVGLDYIVESKDYTAKLAKALNCESIVVKKQVIKLLSALCAYNAEGYTRALEALEKFKELKFERYRLKFIVDELKLLENPLDYKITLLEFVNCLIISAPQFKDRIQMRNEFIGLKLLTVLDDIRRYIECDDCPNHANFRVQLDVFQEQKENDEAQATDSIFDIDLNSHIDVFYTILQQIAETPQEISFLSILQHLLRIDPKEAISDIIWDTAEKLVHRATLLESQQDVTRTLRLPSLLSRHCSHNHQSVPDVVCGSQKQSLNIPTLLNSVSPSLENIPLLPLPVSLGSETLSVNFSSPPPPPPPLPSLQTTPDQPIVEHSIIECTLPVQPPPPIASHQKATHTLPEPMEIVDLRLPQQETPTPKIKMKTINWNKIPDNKVVGRHNIWSLVARSHEHSPMVDLDWSEMENLFCQQAPPSTMPSIQCSQKLNSNDLPDVYERRRKEPSEIVLLDGKRSLNVNIFLKQFRCLNEDIIQIIRDGRHEKVGAEKLRGLLKMLPEIDELEMLRTFNGDKSKLANAEKFLLQLITVPNYKLHIESMLLKEEYATNASYLEQTINSMIVTGEDLMSNKALQEVLYMVLCVGNFLNSGGYAGNAAGVKLTSLQKLTDIRANKPGMNLIHYVALQIEKKRRDLITFADNISSLDDASKTTVEQLRNEVQALDNRIQKIEREVEMPTTGIEIKDQMRDFLKMVEEEVLILKRDLEELENLRKSLADFFCEDVTTFKIEECFKIFHGFCVKFKQAIAENQCRRLQEQQANARRKHREEQLAVRKRNMANLGSTSPTYGESRPITDVLNDMQPKVLQKRLHNRDSRISRLASNKNPVLSEEEPQSVTNSPIISRRRLGSYTDDPYSSDITPTGSLRQRRNRVPSKEDETALMDFLRTSEKENPRERKLWGSLDRSWARRARGGGRNRPDLLNANFSNDRERPASPSILENKPSCSTPEGRVKAKAWRQKIEAWLEENEKEEKQLAKILHKPQRCQYKNRKSTENESENEGEDLDSKTFFDHARQDSRKNLQEQSLGYKKAYLDWEPTVDKTDVLGTMAAIENIQSQPQVRDKSAWRKSQLNTGTFSLENAALDGKKFRIRSKASLDSSSPLEAIEEEEKKKKLNRYAEPNSVFLINTHDLNFLNPIHCTPFVANKKDPATVQSSKSEANDTNTSYPGQNGDFDVSDKIEIDSDNIETPPATRKMFSYSRNNLTRSAKDDEEKFGDGLFDRFSSMRRTRRYRKVPEEDTNIQRANDTLLQGKLAQSTTSEIKSQMMDIENQDNSGINSITSTSCIPNKKTMEAGIGLKKETTIRRRIPVLQRSYIRKNLPSATLPYLFKTQIPPTAGHSYLPKGCENNEESSSIHIRNSSFIPGIKVCAQTPIESKIESIPDFQDKSFEEKQSRTSSSRNQTSLPGYNYNTNTIGLFSPDSSNNHKDMSFSQTDSTESADLTSGCDFKVAVLNEERKLSTAIKPELKISLLPKRTNSIRLTQKLLELKQIRQPPLLAKSSNNQQGVSKIENLDPSASCQSMLTKARKEIPTALHQYPPKGNLKSSSSSLNSCSFNRAVKTVKPNNKIDNYSNVIKSLTLLQKKQANATAVAAKEKKPLTVVHTKVKVSNSALSNKSYCSTNTVESTNMVPVCHSSSSTVSSSFKENNTISTHEHSGKCNLQNFMRPTASSSARDLTDSKQKLGARITPFR